MITLGSFKDIDPQEYDEIWLIVRSLKDRSILTRYNNVRHVPELSPSSELFAKYLEWKRSGAWDQFRFENGYVPTFLVEMCHPIPRDYLNELYLKDKAGKKILLVCFCPDEYMCHRSIVGGLLQGVGTPVVSTVAPFFVDYSKYYTLYKSIKEKNSQC